MKQPLIKHHNLCRHRTDSHKNGSGSSYCLNNRLSVRFHGYRNLRWLVLVRFIALIKFVLCEDVERHELQDDFLR